MAMFRNAIVSLHIIEQEQTITSSQYLALVVLIAPYVYDRYVGLSTMMSNRPGKMQPVNNFSSYEIKFHDRIRNCEDILLEEDLGIAFLSCDPGRDRWNTVMVILLPRIYLDLHQIFHKICNILTF